MRVKKDSRVQLHNAPIVEAIIEIDCDLRPGFQIELIEAEATNLIGARYPVKSTQNSFSVQLSAVDPPSPDVPGSGILAYRFQSLDGKQVIQIRANGFSFNRLKPYSSLDDYLPEIERAWAEYVKIASPVLARVLRLRYLNVIALPVRGERFEMNDYLKIGPRIPCEDDLVVNSFANNSISVEPSTGHFARVGLASFPPTANEPGGSDDFGVLLDIEVAARLEFEADDWNGIISKLDALRDLKNRLFFGSMEERCLQLFQ